MERVSMKKEWLVVSFYDLPPEEIGPMIEDYVSDNWDIYHIEDSKIFFTRINTFNE
jgi:hypothetical protein